jgi:hypothetical protein
MVYAGFVAPFAEEKRRTPVKERASERTCGVKESERENVWRGECCAPALQLCEEKESCLAEVRVAI